MKTSFYFFIWIIIYPLLALLHNQWIYQNSFIVALIIVWALSWLINRNMPEIIRYEGISNRVEILEEVFSGDISSFRKRLSKMMTIEFITSIYFGVTFVFILFSMVRGNADDWIALLIFGFFAFGAITKAFKINKANNELKHNPSRDECEAIVETIFGLDYSSYYNYRRQVNANEFLPQEPRGFKAFQIVSLIFAIICFLFGLFYLISSIIILVENSGVKTISASIMYFLYGSLAAYFGIKDCFNSISYFRRRRKFRMDS